MTTFLQLLFSGVLNVLLLVLKIFLILVMIIMLSYLLYGLILFFYSLLLFFIYLIILLTKKIATHLKFFVFYFTIKSCYYVFIIYLIVTDKTFRLSKINYLITLIEKHKEFAFFIFFNFFSITCLIILFWLRVIYERSPRDLSIFSLPLIFVSINMIIIYLFHLYITFKLLKQSKEDENNNKNILKKLIYFFKEKVSFIYTEIQKAYSGLLDLIINDPYFFYCFEYLILSLVNFKYNKYLYYIIFILPRIIFICVFLVEVIWFNYIDISYKILWLLLIPIFGRIFRFTIHECSTLNIYYLSYIIVITPLDGPIRETYYEKCFFDLEKKKYCKLKFKTHKIIEEIYDIEDLVPLVKQHLRSEIFLKHNQNFYDLDTSKFIIIVNIIIIILTIIVWSYILYLMLSCLNWVYIIYIIKKLFL